MCSTWDCLWSFIYTLFSLVLFFSPSLPFTRNSNTHCVSLTSSVPRGFSCLTGRPNNKTKETQGSESDGDEDGGTLLHVGEDRCTGHWTRSSHTDRMIAGAVTARRCEPRKERRTPESSLGQGRGVQSRDEVIRF